MYSRLAGRFFSGELCSDGAIIGEKRRLVSRVASRLPSGNRETPDGRASPDLRRISRPPGRGLQSVGRNWKANDCLFHSRPGGIRTPLVAPAGALLRDSLLRTAAVDAVSFGMGWSGCASS